MVELIVTVNRKILFELLYFSFCALYKMKKGDIMKVKSYLAGLFMFSCIAYSVFAANLTVDIQNLNSTKGQVLVGLYNDSSNFPVLGKEYKGEKIYPITTQSPVVIFKDLPAGTYAVAVIQDKEMTGKMATGLFGIPLEQYGFSNYNQSGKASFNQAKFVIGNEDTKITVNLR
jgi:uncharacterized protein (DUF2141 family)